MTFKLDTTSIPTRLARVVQQPPFQSILLSKERPMYSRLLMTSVLEFQLFSSGDSNTLHIFAFWLQIQKCLQLFNRQATMHLEPQHSLSQGLRQLHALDSYIVCQVIHCCQTLHLEDADGYVQKQILKFLQFNTENSQNRPSQQSVNIWNSFSAHVFSSQQDPRSLSGD